MSHVPIDARWFIAELVLEITVEGDERNVVHRNVVLVEANSPEEAYRKSLELGQESNVSFKNEDNKTVRITFRGLAELDVVGNKLIHGTELFFTEQIGVSKEGIDKLILPKEQLSVFLPIEPSGGPKYGAR